LRKSSKIDFFKNGKDIGPFHPEDCSSWIRAQALEPSPIRTAIETRGRRPGVPCSNAAIIYGRSHFTRRLTRGVQRVQSIHRGCHRLTNKLWLYRDRSKGGLLGYRGPTQRLRRRPWMTSPARLGPPSPLQRPSG
jgi:hypothetical protein